MWAWLCLRACSGRAQVRLASVAENGFNAVERVSEFCELPQEAPEEIAGSKPDDWPDMGKVGWGPSLHGAGSRASVLGLCRPCGHELRFRMATGPLMLQSLL